MVVIYVNRNDIFDRLILPQIDRVGRRRSDVIRLILYDYYHYTPRWFPGASDYQLEDNIEKNMKNQYLAVVVSDHFFNVVLRRSANKHGLTVQRLIQKIIYAICGYPN